MANPTLPNGDPPEASDALYDTTPAAMRDRFGRRTADLMRQDRDASVAARLAASYAFQVDPTLRMPDAVVCVHRRLTLLTDGVVTVYRCDDCGEPMTHVIGGGFYSEVKH